MSANARVIKNSVVFVAEYDMSGDENEITFSGNVDAKEATVMTDTAHLFKPGLMDFELSLKGFNAFEEKMLDDTMFAKLGTELIPVSILPEGVGTVGQQSYSFRAANLGYESKVTVGEMPAFTLTYKGNSMPVVCGKLLKTPVEVTSFPFTGTGVLVGAVSATKKGYGILHVTGLTGSGTLTAKIQSSDTLGGTYTDRITFTDATEIGSEWKSVDGPITDTYWRVTISVTGFTGATAAICFGAA